MKITSLIVLFSTLIVYTQSTSYRANLIQWMENGKICQAFNLNQDWKAITFLFSSCQVDLTKTKKAITDKMNEFKDNAKDASCKFVTHLRKQTKFHISFDDTLPYRKLEPEYNEYMRHSGDYKLADESKMYEKYHENFALRSQSLGNDKKIFLFAYPSANPETKLELKTATSPEINLIKTALIGVSVDNDEIKSTSSVIIYEDENKKWRAASTTHRANHAYMTPIEVDIEVSAKNKIDLIPLFGDDIAPPRWRVLKIALDKKIKYFTTDKPPVEISETVNEMTEVWPLEFIKNPKSTKIPMNVDMGNILTLDLEVKHMYLIITYLPDRVLHGLSVSKSITSSSGAKVALNFHYTHNVINLINQLECKIKSNLAELIVYLPSPDKKADTFLNHFKKDTKEFRRHFYCTKIDDNDNYNVNEIELKVITAIGQLYCLNYEKGFLIFDSKKPGKFFCTNFHRNFFIDIKTEIDDKTAKKYETYLKENK